MRAWASGIWRFDGRIGREQFWNGIGLLIISGFGFGIIGVAWLAFMWILALSGIGLAESTGILLVLGPLFSLAALQLYWLLALCAKRWHDLGRSGWCSIGLVVPPPIAYTAAEGGSRIDSMAAIVVLVCAVFFVWALVLVGVVKGGSEL